MWASITFTIYAGLYINLILEQLNVDRNYMYNTALKNVVYSLKYSDGNKNIEDITSYKDLVDWLDKAFPSLASEYTQVDTNFTGFYIQDVNYLLGNTLRLCFQLSQVKNEDNQDVFLSDYYKTMDVIDEDVSNFQGSSSGKTYEYETDGYHESGAFC